MAFISIKFYSYDTGYIPSFSVALCAVSAVAVRIVSSQQLHAYHIISYHIVSYQKVRQLLREPRPYVHYKSQPNAKTPKKTQKSTNIKSLNTAARNGGSRVNPADERFLHNFKATLSAG